MPQEQSQPEWQRREQLVKLAREAVAGRQRRLEDGSVETKLPEFSNPAAYDQPEWVLEAMAKAFSAGRALGRGELYPEAG